MTSNSPTPMAWPMAYPNGMAECYVTGRYETERKNHQDPDEISRFSYAPDPVDNSGMDRRADRWMVADEQFELHIASLQTHAGRRTRMLREQWVTTPEVEEARAFEEKTEQLRRVIAAERERWLAEQRRKA